MDCEACTDRLIDLLDGELEDADAEAARAHLEACERCAGAFERLSAGQGLASRLVLAEPPRPVLESVLLAARERAGRISAQPEPAVAPVQVRAREEIEEDTEGGLAASLARWLGSFVMGPQVAMAMMLVLMVGIGLWYLPKWRGADPMEAHDIVSSNAGEEVGPSVGLLPAEPLALEEDPRRARIRPRVDEPEAARPPRSRSRPAPAPSPVAEAAPAPEPVRASAGRAGAAAPSVRDEPTVVAQESEPEAAEAESPARALLADVASASEADPMLDESASQTRSAQTRSVQARSARAAPPREPGEAAGPAELHRQARGEAASGACARAVRTYERLLAQHASYPRAGDARVELADCYRRLGRLPQARRALETASRDTRSASRAQRELMRLEAAERAMGRHRTETDRAPDRPARRAAEAYEALDD